MDTNESIVKSLEAKIKILEIENQKLQSIINANNNEIIQYRALIHSLSDNNTSNLNNQTPFLHVNSKNKIINLNFEWKTNSNGRISNDSKTIMKINGNGGWNCTAIGNKSLIKGEINKWKIQLRKRTSSILFGIVPNDINIEANENWKKGYITNADNFDKHNLGVCQKLNSCSAVEGNVIEIIANLEKCEISFYLNGKDLGIFCDNIIKDIDYVPFVEILNKGDEVTLLQ